MQENISPSKRFDEEIAWTRAQMQRCRRAVQLLPDLTQTKIACCTHLDIKMVPAFEGLIQRGASLFLTTCNPFTVRDEVVDHLSKACQVHARYGMDQSSWKESLQEAVNWQPSHLCEMGADLTRLVHEESIPSSRATSIQASVEATSSGISGVKNIALRYPIFDWNNVPIKEHLHNRLMVGLSTWHTFFECTRLTLHEKRVAIVGYGAVGQSLADSARAYGGSVTIVELNKARALQATYAGWMVLPLDEALASADVVVTATGAPNVIGARHFAILKTGAFLLNVGHRADEINTSELLTHEHRKVLPFVEEISIAGRIVYLVAGGSMANLTAGYGDSLNAFDLTMAIMVAAIGHAVSAGQTYEPGLYDLPESVWNSII